VKLDAAAAAVWIAHGLVMNGGVLHCIEALSRRELRSAIAGYRLFGLADAAEALERGMTAPPEDAGRMEAVLDHAYNQAVPDDGFLSEQMNKVFPPETPPPTAGLVGRQAIDAAITQFIEASSAAVRLSIVPGRTRSQHRANDQVEAAIRVLLIHWDAGGHVALRSLLAHVDDAVRVSAAAYLAISDPEVGIPILEELDQTKPPVSLAAMGTLFAIRHGHFDDPLKRLRATQK
jgi:hypothetical protein